MRAFDWRPLLEKQRVPFITTGANVKRGELNIRCPWCGQSDPSYHLGINLETGWYSCWRNRAAHSGKSPVRLVMKLLGIAYWQAREACGLGESFVDPEGFDAAAARIMGREPLVTRPEQVRRTHLDMPAEFIEIRSDAIRSRAHWNYLYRRGFEGDDIDAVCRVYGLRACRTGHWAQRIVIPYLLDSRLVTWTARAIAPSTVRYMDLGVDESLVPAKETLYNHDCIPGGGKALVLVEGPIDALKLDYYSREYGVRAVGMSTNSLTDAQAYMLEAAVPKFGWLGVMMDNQGVTGGAVEAMRIRAQLSFFGDVRTLTVPGMKKDAGESAAWEIQDWARRVTANERTRR